MTDEEIAHRASIVVHGFSWLGTPYRHQMSVRGQGTDCLGLIRGIWRAVHGSEPEAVPPYTADWAERDPVERLLAAAARHLDPVEGREPVAGDVLLFRMVRGGPVKHCGLHVGQGRFLHAYGGQAVTCSWYAEFWQARLAGIFAIPMKNGTSR